MCQKLLGAAKTVSGVPAGDLPFSNFSVINNSVINITIVMVTNTCTKLHIHMIHIWRFTSTDDFCIELADGSDCEY